MPVKAEFHTGEGVSKVLNGDNMSEGEQHRVDLCKLDVKPSGLLTISL